MCDVYIRKLVTEVVYIGFVKVHHDVSDNLKFIKYFPVINIYECLCDWFIRCIVYYDMM